MANKRRFGWHSGKAIAKEVVSEKVNIPQIVTLGLPQVVASASFPYEVTTNTEASSTYAKVYDLSATEFQDLATSGTGAGYIANYQLTPDTSAVGDMCYFGATSPFGAMYLDMSTTVQTYSNDCGVWEYYNGSTWVTFTPYDVTDQTAQDGKRPFGADGYVFVHAPGWQPVEVDSLFAYWIRFRTTAATITQCGLTNSKEHYVVSSTGSRVHTDGKISKGCFKFGTNSASNNNTSFIVANLSKGYFDNISLVKAVVQQEITMDVEVDSGDHLAWYCYAEDGTTEFAVGTVELYIDKR